MNRKQALRNIAYYSIFTALTFVATILIRIPMASTSGGYINFGDSIIFIASAILGPIGGLVSGALGSVVADLIYAPQYALITLIAKGLEGLVAGYVVYFIRLALKDKKIVEFVSNLVGFIVGGLVMVLFYYVGTGILMGILEESMTNGFYISLLDVPSNFIQMGVSIAVGYAIVLGLIQIPYIKTVRDSQFIHKK